MSSTARELLDLQYLATATAVFAHPLLASIRSKNDALSEEECHRETVNYPTEKMEQQSIKTDDEQQQFIDPLSAISIEKSAFLDSSTHNGEKANGLSSSNIPIKSNNAVQGDFKITADAILSTDRLDNTLAEREQEQWPIEGLDPELVGHRPWRILRQRILDNYANTTDRLSLESSFLRAPVMDERKLANENTRGSFQQRRKYRNISGSSASSSQFIKEKRKYIISEHQPESIAKFYELSQEEWVRKLSELRHILMIKWKEEKRLDCIKLVAEVTALIATNIACAQFYPAQFVHVTDFLDLFGSLVYERLIARAKEERRIASLGPLPAHFDTNDVLEDTRLKARNWFGKVNEMATLLAPRIYILTTLLPCQRFMDSPSAIQENLLELCLAVKQVQHPLIASYLRCYICRVAMRLNAAERAPHWRCLNDWLQTYSQQPISLLGPAMEWVVQCVAYNAVAYADLHPLWEYCRLPEQRPVILIPMLNALPRLYIGEHALEACRIVTGSEMVSGEELCALGTNLLEAEVPTQVRKPILKSVWKCIMRLASMKHYVMCCECWVEFVARYFSSNEVNVVLDNLLRKLQPDKYEHYQPQLLSILRKVFIYSQDIAALFAMEVFSKLVDIFRTATAREESAHSILSAIIKKHQLGTFTDIDLAYQILSICHSLHDCVGTSSSSSDNRVATIVQLIVASLDRIDLNADPEQCLNFLVSCRADLANIDSLQKYVLRRVQTFTLHITRSVRYSSSRAAFLQGCLANLFISIPSLLDPVDRIEFSIQSAQIALAALSFLQAEAFVDLVLIIFDGFPTDAAPHICRLGTYFLATLSYLPSQQNVDDEMYATLQIEEVSDHERERQGQWQGPLKHFRRFLHFILNFSWPSLIETRLDFVRLLIRCLQYLLIIWAKENEDDQQQSSILCQSCSQSSEQIASVLEGELLDESVSDVMCTVGIELLEVLAQFRTVNLDLPSSIHLLANAVYKRCKRRPPLATRIQWLRNHKLAS